MSTDPTTTDATGVEEGKVIMSKESAMDYQNCLESLDRLAEYVHRNHPEKRVEMMNIVDNVIDIIRRYVRKPLTGFRRVRPFRERLYIRCFSMPEETVTDGGIILHRRGVEREIEKTLRALVLGVGEGCSNNFKVGDFVLVARFSGTMVLCDDLSNPDNNFTIIHEDAVLGWDDPQSVMKELCITQEEVDEMIEKGTRAEAVVSE